MGLDPGRHTEVRWDEWPREKRGTTGSKDVTPRTGSGTDSPTVPHVLISVGTT